MTIASPHGSASMVEASWSGAIERLPGKAEGRSAGTAFGPLVFLATVAHDRTANFRSQVLDVLSRIEEQLHALGSDKTIVLSTTVYFADMTNKPDFDAAWIDWIGPDRQAWPQRACVGATLAGGTLIEIALIAARRQAVSQ